MAVGETATFSVVAESPDGGSLSYQWESDDVDQTWGEIPAVFGGTLSELIIPNVDLWGNGMRVRCKVTNTKEEIVTKTEYSDEVTLTVSGASVEQPIITQQPNDVIVVPLGEAQFSVVAESPDGWILSYQWRRSENGGSTWLNIAEADTDTYTIASALNDYNGYLYLCRVTNTRYGMTATVDSDIATLIVDPNLPSITQQPVDTIVAEGGTATFNVTAESSVGGTLYYQWMKKLTGSDTFSMVSGAVSHMYTFSHAAIASNNAHYKCRILSTETSNELYSEEAVLSVIGKPVITEQPEDVAVTLGQFVQFGVVAESPDEGELSYQWQESHDGGDTWTNSEAEGANIEYLNIGYTFDATYNGRLYHCIITNTLNEISATTTSENAMLTVTPAEG